MKGHVEIGHLTKFDSKVNRDQVMTRETCMVKARGLKIHTNVYNFVTAPPQNHINSLKFFSFSFKL